MEIGFPISLFELHPIFPSAFLLSSHFHVTLVSSSFNVIIIYHLIEIKLKVIVFANAFSFNGETCFYNFEKSILKTALNHHLFLFYLK